MAGLTLAGLTLAGLILPGLILPGLTEQPSELPVLVVEDYRDALLIDSSDASG